MSLEKMGKNPGWVLADTRNDPSFHMLKNQHYSKGGKIFNINFQLLTSFFFLFDFESNLDIRAKVSLTNL